jgi:hypothetical protein
MYLHVVEEMRDEYVAVLRAVRRKPPRRVQPRVLGVLLLGGLAPPRDP